MSPLHLEILTDARVSLHQSMLRALDEIRYTQKQAETLRITVLALTAFPGEVPPVLGGASEGQSVAPTHPQTSDPEPAGPSWPLGSTAWNTLQKVNAAEILMVKALQGISEEAGEKQEGKGAA